LATVPIGQEAGHGPGQQGHSHEKGADPRGLAFALLEVFLELDEYDAEREGHAVRDHVDHERREHDHPSPTTVRSPVNQVRRLRRRIVRVGGRVRRVRIVNAVVMVVVLMLTSALVDAAAAVSGTAVIGRFVVLAKCYVIFVVYDYFSFTFAKTTTTTTTTTIITNAIVTVDIAMIRIVRCQQFLRRGSFLVIINIIFKEITGLRKTMYI